MPGMAPGMLPGMPGLPMMPQGMPGMQPMLPGMPGMPMMPPGMAMMPVGGPMMMDPMLMAQQQAMMQQQVVDNATVDPDVMELAHHCGLSDKQTRELNTALKVRKDTFEDDLAALWDAMEDARHPAGLLMAKVKQMNEGNFVGRPEKDKKLDSLVKRYNLDANAHRKLAEVLKSRPENKDRDLEALEAHLENSNKPSALVMMMLNKLRKGEELPKCEYRPAVGSYRSEKERKRELEERERRDGKKSYRSRSRSRRGHREREKGRDRSRDRDRDRRKRSRSRSKDKDKKSRSRSRKKSRSKSRGKDKEKEKDKDKD